MSSLQFSVLTYQDKQNVQCSFYISTPGKLFGFQTSLLCDLRFILVKVVQKPSAPTGVRTRGLLNARSWLQLVRHVGALSIVAEEVIVCCNKLNAILNIFFRLFEQYLEGSKNIYRCLKRITKIGQKQYLTKTRALQPKKNQQIFR